MSNYTAASCCICSNSESPLLALGQVELNKIKVYKNCYFQFYTQNNNFGKDLVQVEERGRICCERCRRIISQIYALNKIVEEVTTQIKDLVRLCHPAGDGDEGENHCWRDELCQDDIKEETVSSEDEVDGRSDLDQKSLFGKEIQNEIGQPDGQGLDSNSDGDQHLLRTRSTRNGVMKRKSTRGRISSSSASDSAGNSPCPSCSDISDFTDSEKDDSNSKERKKQKTVQKKADIEEDNEILHICRYCSLDNFSNPSARYRHQTVCPQRNKSSEQRLKVKHESLTCPNCSKSFGTRKLCLVHQVRICQVGSDLSKEELEKAGMFFCTWNNCTRIFAQRSKLNRHLRHHEGKKNWLCSSCGKTFYEKYKLNEHSKRKFDCRLSNSERFLHRYNSTPRPFPCPRAGCLSTWETETRLFAHIAKVHDDQKSLQNENNLQNELVVCSVCGKSFKSKSMRDHMKRMHEQKKNHGCSFCDKFFYSLREVRVHTERIHSQKDGGAHKCPQCDKHFTHLTYVAKHLYRIHGSGLEKKWGCGECGFKFKTKTELVRHERRKHSTTQKNAGVSKRKR